VACGPPWFYLGLVSRSSVSDEVEGALVGPGVEAIVAQVVNCGDVELDLLSRHRLNLTRAELVGVGHARASDRDVSTLRTSGFTGVSEVAVAFAVPVHDAASFDDGALSVGQLGCFLSLGSLVVVVRDGSADDCSNEGEGATGDSEDFGVDVDVHGFS